MINSSEPCELRFSGRDFRNVALLVAISILMFCLAPNVRGLWVLDEVRYGEAVRSMVDSGRIFTPHMNGEIYSDKPPLFFWYLMLFAKLTGSIQPWVFFISTSVSGVACVLALYALGRLIHGPVAAFLASLTLLSSLLFIGIAQFVRMDLLMLLFMILAFHAFAKGRKTGNRRHYYLIYIYLALSVLTKRAHWRLHRHPGHHPVPRSRLGQAGDRQAQAAPGDCHNHRHHRSLAGADNHREAGRNISDAYGPCSLSAVR